MLQSALLNTLSPYRLFVAPSPGKAHEDGDFLRDLNPNSLTLLKSAYVEPSLATAKPGDTFQFERLGYFCMDAEREGESAGQPVLFNRVVTLKDTWAGGVLRLLYSDDAPSLLLSI